MNRLDRRQKILRSKRNGCFDPNQYYLERALRARAARKVRTLLRHMQPVVVVTPRWSCPKQFLDDIAADLYIGEPRVKARCLSLQPLQGKNPHEVWRWMVRAVTEVCDLSLDGPVHQAMDRHGFRLVMAQLFRRTMVGPRRALLIHGLEYLSLEVRDDVVRVLEDHVTAAGVKRRLNLLLAGSVDSPHFHVEGAERVVLPDFGESEALEALVEHLSINSREDLEEAAELVGGVPAIVEAIGIDAERNGGKIARTPEALWRALGPLADEIRAVVDIVTADDVLAERLEKVAKDGTLIMHPDQDEPLVRAGLLKRIEWMTPAKVGLRAPVFADLTSAQTEAP